MSTIARMLSVVALVGNAALTGAISDEAAAPPAARPPAAMGSGIPVVHPFFMLSGALLKDGFDGPQLDATLWSRPPWLVENHKTIGVNLENGHLVISGPSHPEKQQHQDAGILSRYFRDTDVVLAAELQAKSPFDREGRIQHMVHLWALDLRHKRIKQ